MLSAQAAQLLRSIAADQMNFAHVVGVNGSKRSKLLGSSGEN